MQQLGCILVVSLAVKGLVAYVLLLHYILVMEAAGCAHWIGKVVLEGERWAEANTYTPINLLYLPAANSRGLLQ